MENYLEFLKNSATVWLKAQLTLLLSVVTSTKLIWAILVISALGLQPAYWSVILFAILVGLVFLLRFVSVQETLSKA